MRQAITWNNDGQLTEAYMRNSASVSWTWYILGTVNVTNQTISLRYRVYAYMAPGVHVTQPAYHSFLSLAMEDCVNILGPNVVNHMPMSFGEISRHLGVLFSLEFW